MGKGSTRVSRRDFLQTGAAVGAATVLGRLFHGAGGCVCAEARGRVIILGFDGVERSIVDKMLEAGELPNLAKLRERGMYGTVKTSIPPQSPVAWASFATCKNPGNHGLFDFIIRDPRRYVPRVGFGTVQDAKPAADGSLVTPAKGINYRKGEPFWVAADKQGARCKILSVPFMFPPDALERGCMLSGEGVPDIRGTTSTFFWLSDAFTPAELEESLSGGIRVPITFNGDSATVQIPGMRRLLAKDKEYVQSPVELTVDRETHTVRFAVGDRSQVVPEHGWSEWFEWSFQQTQAYTVRAIGRFYVSQAGEHVRIYMTCLQFHPRAPYMTFTSPTSYAGELADRYGLYETIGWRYDTHAVRQGALAEGPFLDVAAAAMKWQERLTLDELETDAFDLLISMSTATDRVAHMFWRFRDPQHPMYTAEGAKEFGRAIENTYALMDETVGGVMARLRDTDLLIVLSDHGFQSFRTGFSVNTWLVRNGYLSIKGRPDSETANTDKQFLDLGGNGPYDWANTMAYGLGFGSIYLNLEGRERDGVVSPEDAPGLLAEIKDKLLSLTDPATGDKVFSNVYTKEVYQGIAAADAPDIELGYAVGYQTAKTSAAGAAPADLFGPNKDKWSGEHAASDPANAPGVLFAGRVLAGNAALIDLGATALAYLGLEIPGDFEGKSLL